MFSIDYKLPPSLEGKPVEPTTDLPDINSVLFIPERFLARREAFSDSPVIVFTLSDMTEEAQANNLKEPSELGDTHPINWMKQVSDDLDDRFKDLDESFFLNKDWEGLLEASKQIIGQAYQAVPLLVTGVYFQDNSLYLTDVKDEFVSTLRVFQTVLERTIWNPTPLPETPPTD